MPGFINKPAPRELQDDANLGAVQELSLHKNCQDSLDYPIRLLYQGILECRSMI
jgi:hypothetical protein